LIRLFDNYIIKLQLPYKVNDDAMLFKVISAELIVLYYFISLLNAYYLHHNYKFYKFLNKFLFYSFIWKITCWEE